MAHMKNSKKISVTRPQEKAGEWHEPNLEGPRGYGLEIRFHSEEGGEPLRGLYSSCRGPE